MLLKSLVEPQRGGLHSVRGGSTVHLVAGLSQVKIVLYNAKR